MTEKKKGVRKPFRSIQSTLFAAIAILMLSAILIMTGVSVYFSSSSLSENSRSYTRTIIRQMNENIDSYISYMDNMTSVFISSEDVQRYLSEDDAISRGRLLEQFDTILKSRDDIKNVGILLEDGRYLINKEGQTINQDLDLNTQSWYVEAVSNGSRFSLSSSHVQHVVADERSWVITLSRRIQNARDGSSTAGVVFLDLNYRAISEMCNQNNLGELGYVFVLNEKGEIVYHPRQQEIYNELQTEHFEELIAAETSEVIIAGEGKMYQISRSEKTGWLVVGCINSAALFRQSRQSTRFYMGIGLVLIFIALILSRILARGITRPIQKLQSSMKQVQEGDFSGGNLEIRTQNEVGSLTKSFNIMIDRIQTLMAQNEKDQEEKRKSELMALQSQINPHFLYNTLDSIIWMAEGKKNEEVVLMTASLAKLLRQKSMSEDETMILKHEMDYINSYLTIQKMRYKDKLEYTIEVEPQLQGCQILRMTVQPIVENAIYHGLKYKEDKGYLHIQVKQEAEDILILIEDNGKGMDEETLMHIFDKHQVNYRSNGIAVYNVQRRLKLYYGEKYGLSYESVLNQGTKAIIRIPVNAGGVS